MVAALGGVEGDRVGAGGPAGDGLGERAGALEKATCAPWGAGGLPEVKPLLLAAMPALPEKVQAEPVGGTGTCPHPPAPARTPRRRSRTTGRRDDHLIDEGGVVTPGMSRPWKVIVCDTGRNGERGGGVSSDKTCPRV